jgi:hypothetical protein
MSDTVTTTGNCSTTSAAADSDGSGELATLAATAALILRAIRWPGAPLAL